MGSGHLARRKCNSGHYWNETDKILGLVCPICGKAGVQVSTFTCPSCRGAKDIVTGTKTCTKCKGSGRAQVQTGSTVCTECNGAKTVKESDICCYCFGEGIVGKLPAPKLPMASYMQGKTYIRDLGDEYECTFLDFPSLKDAFFGGDRSFHINDRPYQSENEYLMPDATLRTVIVAAYRQKRTATRPFSLASKISIQTTAEDYAPPELNKGGHTYRLFSVSNPESGGLDGKEVVIVGTCDNIYWQNVAHRPYGGKSNLPLKYYAIKAENYDYDQKANWLRGQPGTFVGDEFEARPKRRNSFSTGIRLPVNTRSDPWGRAIFSPLMP